MNDIYEYGCITDILSGPSMDMLVFYMKLTLLAYYLCWDSHCQCSCTTNVTEGRAELNGNFNNHLQLDRRYTWSQAKYK